MAAQIVHAAGESIQEPLPPNTNAVVLAVKSEPELRHIAKKLQLCGVKHILIQETDPPYAGQCTAIGCVPLTDRSVVKKIFSSLPLLRAAPLPEKVVGGSTPRGPLSCVDGETLS